MVSYRIVSLPWKSPGEPGWKILAGLNFGWSIMINKLSWKRQIRSENFPGTFQSVPVQVRSVLGTFSACLLHLQHANLSVSLLPTLICLQSKVVFFLFFFFGALSKLSRPSARIPSSGWAICYPLTCRFSAPDDMPASCNPERAHSVSSWTLRNCSSLS